MPPIPPSPYDGDTSPRKRGEEVRSVRRLFRHVERVAAGLELVAHLVHALLGIVADVLGDAHGAELRPAHRAEVRRLVRLLGQSLVVELLRRRGVERQVELILPTELEARL